MNRDPRTRLGMLVLAGTLIGGILLLWGGQRVPPDVALGDALIALRDWPWTGPLLALGTVAAGVVVLPVSPFLIGFGAIFGIAGLWWGPPSVLVGCLGGYALGRAVGAGADPIQRGRIGALIERHGTAAAFVARVIPGMPCGVVNVLLGHLRVPFAAYLAGSAIVFGLVAPGLVVSGALGAEALARIRAGISYGWLLEAMGAIAGFWLIRAGRGRATRCVKGSPGSD